MVMCTWGSLDCKTLPGCERAVRRSDVHRIRGGAGRVAFTASAELTCTPMPLPPLNVTDVPLADAIPKA
jgi:hypothetical protein